MHKSFLSLKLSLMIIGLMIVCISPSYGFHWEVDREYLITILHTNDHHGSFWPDKQGQGGLAAQYTLVKKIRAELKQKGGYVLLLSAGDINIGEPESDLLNAKPDFIGMGLMNFDAMTIGNHEFDSNYETLQQQEKWVNFPFLSANIYHKQTGKRLFKPYTIITFDGLKIAIVGLTTDETFNISVPELKERFTLNSPIAEAQLVLEELAKNEKPDIKIALTHLGYYEDAEHGLNRPGDISLARSLDNGAYDIIIGGHSHTVICMDENNKLIKNYQPLQTCKPDKQNATYIMQAGDKSRYLGRADFIFKNGKLTLTSYHLIPINLKYKQVENNAVNYRSYDDPILPNEEMQLLLTPYQQSITHFVNFNVGKTEILLQGERETINKEQTNLGRFVADAYQLRAEADLSLLNSGSICASIQMGDISYRDLLKVLPFSNQVTTIELTGAQLSHYLTKVALKPKHSDSYAQFSSNVSLKVNYKKRTVTDMTIGGEPINPNKKYRLALTDFILKGGDHYPILANHIRYNIKHSFLDVDIVKQYIERMETIQINPPASIEYLE